MSGTSLDGIDLAECFFSISEDHFWSFEIGVAETIPYPKKWKSRLQQAIHFSEEKLKTLNEEYTQFLGETIALFIETHAINNLDAVCSHGHTILHRPEDGVTLQIGNLPEIAKYSGQSVVCDFRVQDVALGGQGAPLVPVGDRLLFNDYDYCLNLGGFANVSFEKREKRIAYDICPVNIVLNYYAEKLGHTFDDEGKLAASGSLDQKLMDQLSALSYYSEAPPKSLGLEWVQKEILPLLEAANISDNNILHTFTEHAARQIAAQFQSGSSILITGGGAHNTFLLERIKKQKKLNLMVPEDKLLEFKEALIFGLLGVLRLRNEVNCLSSVTGARQDHCSGKVYKL